MVHFMDVVVTVLLCCFLTLVSLWCWIKWRHRHLIRAASNLQSLFPTALILGSLHYTFLGNERLTAYAIDSYMKLCSRGIYTCCVWLGPYPVICVGGVDDLQTVNSSIKVPDRGFEMEIMQFILGNSILTAPGNIWKTKRCAIDPLFQSRNLKQLMPTFNKTSREFVERMSQYDDRGSVDVSRIILNTALQSICHLIFGMEVEFQPQSEEFRNFISLLEKIPEIVMQKVFKFWLQSDFIYKFLYKKHIEVMNVQWEQFTKAPLTIAKHHNKNKYLVKEHRVENDFKYVPEITKEGPLNLITVYNVLQQNFPEFTEEDLKYEIKTMCLTATMTSKNTVSYCLLHLAYHQDIQERLFKEISSVTDLNNDITFEDLQKMPYLDQVFKETLRWSITVPFTSRRAHKDIKLSSCTIPRGSSFVLAINGPFLDSKIYPEPTRFNPEHFSPENSKTRDKSAFLPFNAGPRNCIAKLYTELLAKTIIAYMLRAFKLSTRMDVNNLKRKMDVFISSSEGYNISIQRR